MLIQVNACPRKVMPISCKLLSIALIKINQDLDLISTNYGKIDEFPLDLLVPDLRPFILASFNIMYGCNFVQGISTWL